MRRPSPVLAWRGPLRSLVVGGWEKFCLSNAWIFRAYLPSLFTNRCYAIETIHSFSFIDAFHRTILLTEQLSHSCICAPHVIHLLFSFSHLYGRTMVFCNASGRFSGRARSFSFAPYGSRDRPYFWSSRSPLGQGFLTGHFLVA